MNNGPRSILPDSGKDGILDFALTRSGPDFDNVTMQVGKRTRQFRLPRIDGAGPDDPVIDADQTSVTVHGIGNSECISHRRHVGIQEASPQHHRTGGPGPAADHVVHDDPRSLIAQADRCRIGRIDDRVLLNVDRRRVIRAAADEERLRVHRIVAAGRKSTRIADRHVRMG